MDKKRYILGSDISTSGCKSLVLDNDGKIIGESSTRFKTKREKNGFSEQNPLSWLSSFIKTSQRAIKSANINPESIEVIGIDGVTHNAVLLNSHKEVIRDSILYTDNRCTKEVEFLNNNFGKTIFSETCNSPSLVWTWPHLMWLKKNEPEVWKNIQYILFPKDYIRNSLSDSMVTDLIDPVGSLLYNPIKNCYIEEFIHSLGLSVDVFPKVQNAFDVVGSLNSRYSNILGILKGTPIICGTTDTAAELFGIGLKNPHEASIKLATVGRIYALSTEFLDDPKAINYPYLIRDLWYPGTATKFAASAFTWVINAFYDNKNHEILYKKIDENASLVNPGCDGLIFHPYLDGEFAPYWDNNISGGFWGTKVIHTKNHFIRAVMEGVGYAIRDAFEDMLKHGLIVSDIRLIGGGASSHLWGQIMADILGKKVLVPSRVDAAFGIALMAGFSCNIFNTSINSMDDLIKIQNTYHPYSSNVELYNQSFSIYKDLAQIYSDLSLKYK